MAKAWRYQRDNQNSYIEEEQTTQWSKLEDSKEVIRIRFWLFFFDIRILIISLVSSNFDHCVVCSSSIYGFWLLLWNLLTLVKVWRYQRDNQNLYIEEEQTTQWLKFEDIKGIIRIGILKNNRQQRILITLLVSSNLWPFYCLFFFDIRILITSLVSSNCS
jgi:hypothetical protein